jgi:YebC/PmpR family DNA-binding regulatory protein
MAGHSQYKNIMHRKGKVDAQRAKIFAKLGREITVAAKSGLPDPGMNPRLRLAIQAARAENMPKDNIERAIKKAAGADLETFEYVRYEGYAPGGVAIIVETLTDNRNRTGGNIRAAFTKYDGNLGSTGSVSHMFQHVGEIVYDAKVGSADKVLEAAIEAGADDVASDSDGHVIVTAFDSLGTVAQALEGALGTPASVKVVWKPNLVTQIAGERAESLLKMLQILEDDDDVQSVFSNADFDEATLAKLSG